MLTLLRFSLQNLASHWKLALAMVSLIGLAILFFLTVGGYRVTLDHEYASLPDVHLIVQESNTLAEMYGSRIPAALQTQLLEMGVSWTIAEIHDMVGTSVGDMLMLRGVDPQRYLQVNQFELLEGRALAAEDAPRTVMLGRRLAEKLHLSPGQEILIRGRKFLICGIFHTGAYIDNEAWVSLADAQALLGWGSDVSLFIIPDQGLFQPGDSLPGGWSIAPRGQGANITVNQIAPLLNAMDVVSTALAVAAVFALGNTLARLAWLHRRQLTILRCLGFPSFAAAVYLFAQALALALSGALLGLAGTLTIFTYLRTDVVGMSFHPRLDATLALTTLSLALVISLLGTVIPLLWLNRIRPIHLLRNEA
ncbi:MAG: ABC transporter permease [Anaerolineales bacterium]|nr:ABC transporter permease [Anaerolineales bacterium]